MLTKDIIQKLPFIWYKLIRIDKNQEELFKEYQKVFIIENYTLVSSDVFSGTLNIKNVSLNTLVVGTLINDKLEGEDTQNIFPGESFTIVKYNINDYRII